MKYIVSTITDIGISRKINEDCYRVRDFLTDQGEILFAVLCDGMGGLSKGEIASNMLVDAFDSWAEDVLPDICKAGLTDIKIRNEWNHIIETVDEKIKYLSEQNGERMGTTVTAILVTENRYYIVNVGDTRAYEIFDRVTQLTKDHTLVELEVERGNLTEDEAKKDKRRNILIQCVGASKSVCPDMFFGETKVNSVYLLCSDGFRHEICDEEMLVHLNPSVLKNAYDMQYRLKLLVDLNKQRQEHDNISVIAIRTF